MAASGSKRMHMGRLRAMTGLGRVQLVLRAKGKPYLLAWVHRTTGVLLAVYVLAHIDTLARLMRPAEFTARMALFERLIPVLFEWFLAVPVILHALNGGRLLLFEAYGSAVDEILTTWVFRLSALYLLVLGYLMIVGDQQVSAQLFWLLVTCGGVVLTWAAVRLTAASGASVGWKLQRISGAYLLLAVPAHMLFMHLDPTIGRDGQVIIARLADPFIKVVDFSILIGVLYHGGYGLIGICDDYLGRRRDRLLAAGAIISVFGFFGWQGTKLLISI